jgi:hypothetical protein
MPQEEPGGHIARCVGLAAAGHCLYDSVGRRTADESWPSFATSDAEMAKNVHLADVMPLVVGYGLFYPLLGSVNPSFLNPTPGYLQPPSTSGSFCLAPCHQRPSEPF